MAEQPYGFKPGFFPSAPNFNQTGNAVYNRVTTHPVAQQAYYWSQWSAGQGVPSNAVRGGVDVDGAPIYVGRCNHEGDLLPGKIMPEKNVGYVPFGGEEITVYHGEILCQQSFQWVSSSNGYVPHGAVPIGHTSSGETLYAGRVYHEGSHCIGKIHPSHGKCYIPFGGSEITYHSYEILVLQN